MAILEIIDGKYDTLTKNQKKLADYVRNNLIEIAFMNIITLSQKSGVSTSTITRFVKVLGFNSFPEFQEAVQKIAKKEISPVKEFRFWVTETPKKDMLYDQIEEAKSALDNLYSEETYKTLEAACTAIKKAGNVYILGSRSTFSMAYFCYHFMKRVKENVILLENRNDDISLLLQYVTKNDFLIVIGYPKYTRFTIQIMHFFSDIGSKILSITDSQTSPLAQGADYLIVAKNKLKIYFVTTITILNTLMVMISRMDPQAHIRLFEEENTVTRKLNVYESYEENEEK
ncbi:MurR/RpiR family transcriptional regulator [Acidaminococcus sp. NSJ-142]|uniref:MurR/RpiR family transcriptional regulator n=1 Tax=Acidaminococcus TaxID=904 RepID=UPI001E375EF8|nr:MULTISPECIES: MurR/RpiR family transcriptional regulator [Acidaminococcus]MCD2436119.1 MurR/RpiR family transcriptional regulator [Acidaminococcus hominis]MCH4096679.1 MurR/RpiR family transcriptional regulator [Acidaminococcus provencensis]